MSIAALIRRMAELGAPAEAIALAVEAIEAEQSKDADRRAKRAAQKAKERARVATVERQSRDGETTVDAVSQQESSPPTPPFKEQNHPSKKPPKGGQKGSRLSPDWVASDADHSTAKAMGFTEAQAQSEFDRFRDYWIGKAGKDGVKLDWPATLRNWLRSSAERKGIAPMAQGPPPVEAVPQFENEEERRKWWFSRFHPPESAA